MKSDARRIFDNLGTDQRLALYFGDLSFEDLDLDLASEKRSQLKKLLEKWGDRANRDG